MTLTIDAPLEINGELLLSQLTDAGIAATWITYRPSEGTVTVGGVGEQEHDAVAAVIASHAPTADAAAQAQAQARTNEGVISDRATAALQTNRDFLALASPTNAQTLAQVKALARQNNGLIRLVLNRFDGTD